jgi:hypothetical protein
MLDEALNGILVVVQTTRLVGAKQHHKDVPAYNGPSVGVASPADDFTIIILTLL